MHKIRLNIDLKLTKYLLKKTGFKTLLNAYTLPLFKSSKLDWHLTKMLLEKLVCRLC